MDDMTAAEVVAMLKLQPHPEGGYYRQTFRDDEEKDGGKSGGDGERGRSTAIYYLLAGGDCSAWHRVDAAEVWHHYAGAPLAITLSPDGHDAQAHRLGTDLMGGERPQLVVPKGWWQTAESLGHWTLVGCTVAPGFTFEGFEMAPPDWRPVPRPARG